MTGALKQALTDCEQSLREVSRGAGVPVCSLSRFLSGKQSLRLDMADRLAISEHTVRDHLKRLYRKTGTRSRSELLSILSTARMEPSSSPTGRASVEEPG